ncbi:MAG: hypothetical protein ACO3ST_08855, partial [Burkholderiaceae bacterium]
MNRADGGTKDAGPILYDWHTQRAEGGLNVQPGLSKRLHVHIWGKAHRFVRPKVALELLFVNLPPAMVSRHRTPREVVEMAKC